MGQVRTIVEHRARYERVSANRLPDRDVTFYERVDRELAVVGFQTVGDFEDASLVVADPSKKSFARFAIGAHGAIAAMWFEVPAEEGNSLQCLVLHSWVADGRVIVTERGTVDSGLPMPPEVLVERIDARRYSLGPSHARERVAAPRGALSPHRAGGIARSICHDEVKTAEFRRELEWTCSSDPPHVARRQLRVQGDRFRRIRANTVAARWTRDPRRDRESFPHVSSQHHEHIEPLNRAARYEDPVQDALAIRALGMVTGGGSQLTPAAEIGYVDVEMALADLDEALDVAKRVLEEAGAPVGSQLLYQEGSSDVERSFGVQEGLAIYLDGTSLPDEVYANTDIDALMERLAAAVDSGRRARGDGWSTRRRSIIRARAGRDGRRTPVRIQRVSNLSERAAHHPAGRGRHARVTSRAAQRSLTRVRAR